MYFTVQKTCLQNIKRCRGVSVEVAELQLVAGAQQFWFLSTRSTWGKRFKCNGKKLALNNDA